MNFRRENKRNNKSFKEPNYYSHTKFTINGSYKIKYNHHSEHHNKHTEPIRDDFSEVKNIKNIPIKNIDIEFIWTSIN